MALMPVPDALTRLLDGAAPLPGETVTIEKAAWRVLASDIAALRTQPPFDASAMDGYAVRSVDVVSPPVNLTIIGEAPAGKGFRGTIGPGEAVRIFTGAPVPQGADAVLIQENTRAVSAGVVEALEPVAVLRNIRRAGLDFREGERLLEAGRILDPPALSLVAAANHAALSVVRRPRVAILATGDELLPPGSEVGPDQIIASNAYGVAAIVERTGGVPLDLGIVRDDRAAIDTSVRRAIDAGADMIVTLGGASVGDHDLVRAVLTSAGMSLDFWKIAMRPGKPLMFGRLGEVRVLGLPGNPVASFVCSHLFVAPLVARLAGRPYAVELRDAVLGVEMAANDQREDYVRARAEWRAGQLVASPFPVQDSSMLRTLAEANTLIVRPPFAPAAPEGSSCRVVMLR